jgi:probable rRNA maturation factor
MKINYLVKLKKINLNKQLVNNILNLAANILKIKKGFEVSVIIIGDQKIKSLNKKFRKKNQVTDVLSFSAQEGNQILPQEVDYLGEIFICYPQVIRQAKKYNNSIKDEFSLLLVHGFLHLLGYDHIKQADYLKMKKLEEKIIVKL